MLFCFTTLLASGSLVRESPGKKAGRLLCIESKGYCGSAALSLTTKSLCGLCGSLPPARTVPERFAMFSGSSL